MEILIHQKQQYANIADELCDTEHGEWTIRWLMVVGEEEKKEQGKYKWTMKWKKGNFLLLRYDFLALG